MGATYPVSSEEQACQAVCTSSEEARRATNKPLIHNSDLQKILSQSPNLQVVVICLADPPQETHGTRVTQLKSEHIEHQSFCFNDPRGAISTANHVFNLLNRWTVDFFELGGNKHRRCTHELQPIQRDDLARKEAVNVVDTEVEGFRQERESIVDLHHPVH